MSLYKCTDTVYTLILDVGVFTVEEKKINDIKLIIWVPHKIIWGPVGEMSPDISVFSRERSLIIWLAENVVHISCNVYQERISSLWISTTVAFQDEKVADL